MDQKICELPVRMAENASDTLEDSKAEVSMNNNPFWAAEESIHTTSSEGVKDNPHAKAAASSVGTALRCFKSLLFPTNMITMLESAWSRSSFNQRPALSNVSLFEMS